MRNWCMKPARLCDDKKRDRMKKLTRAPNLITAQHWMNVLSTAGIPCQLHNRYLNGALGEIPADQCAPEIWIEDDRDEALAAGMLENARRGPAPGTRGWRCGQCGEPLEAQFTVCWQCGTERNPLDD
jgi:Putative prokaryotic signal transducing protein